MTCILSFTITPPHTHTHTHTHTHLACSAQLTACCIAHSEPLYPGRTSPWPHYSALCCEGWNPWTGGVDYSQANAGWAPDMSYMANFQVISMSLCPQDNYMLARWGPLFCQTKRTLCRHVANGSNGGSRLVQESSDVFLRILKPNRPAVTIIDKDIFGSDIGLYHGHSLNGVK